MRLKYDDLDQFQKSTIQLEFGHFDRSFWSTFIRNFEVKSFRGVFWHHARPVSEKYDPAWIWSFWSAILVNVYSEFRSEITSGSFLTSCQTSFRKVGSSLNLIILIGHFGQRLVGISKWNYFDEFSDIMPDQFQKSRIQLEFGHFGRLFWSTFSRNFEVK